MLHRRLEQFGSRDKRKTLVPPVKNVDVSDLPFFMAFAGKIPYTIYHMPIIIDAQSESSYAFTPKKEVLIAYHNKIELLTIVCLKGKSMSKIDKCILTFDRINHLKQHLSRLLLLVTLILMLSGGMQHTFADTIVVSTFSKLHDAVLSAMPGDTILLKDGVYTISGTWAIPVRTDNLTIRGQTGNRDSVIIQGWGMNGNSHHCFWVASNYVTIADLTIQNVRNHCIQTDVNVDHLTVRNCILRDAGEQILKVPSGTGADYSENGLVEDCLFEYSAGVGPRSYMGGIDVHRGKDWIVRDNVFQYIRSPGGSISEHAIHFWNDSRNTLVERNQIITCDRGIGFGLGYSGHSGGVIRNNMIMHDGSLLPDGATGFNDVGISLESAPDAQVYNNTIYFEHYYHAIEYRFSETTGVLIANNLANRSILNRNGASAILESNIVNAQSSWFADTVSGDLHLAYHVEDVVDQGTPIENLTNDFDLETRPQNHGIDIGADEFIFCIVDMDGDIDVDGTDLAAFAFDFYENCMEVFSGQFGHY